MHTVCFRFSKVSLLLLSLICRHPQLQANCCFQQPRAHIWISCFQLVKMLCVTASDLHTPKLWDEKGGQAKMGEGAKSDQFFQHIFLHQRQYPVNNNQFTPLLTSLLLSRIFCFPWVEVQRCGANSEDQRGGWPGAGEEVLRADGKHAPQEGRSC